ncbi:hypothetical protein QQX98_001446 [Neonectria punicea]|uniref:Uncharacterized protein n=1 Tax=Neonectria punicea TaxID=979145 RepID=A0ABR1HPJ8_9HYPO
MPITLTIVDHPAQPWKSPRVTTPEALLEQASPKDFKNCERIFQSSFPGSALAENYTSPSKNGFVWAAYHAYSDHHHLTIRPEDIWFAIVTQLSFHINANAEKLRSFFVEHEGQKKLEVIVEGNRHTVDFGALAECMTHLISENVKDAELRSWVMPAFSTTTDTDRVVASVLFMGAMQKYFSYQMTMTCGIPSVTLLGEVADYENILARLDKLEQLGDEPTRFAQMLRPILRYMIFSFKEPTSPEVISFWNRIASRDDKLSGYDFLCGWIIAFCYWDAEGKPKFLRDSEIPRFVQGCVLDGVIYPKVDTGDIPSGFTTVPVTVDDNGEIFECTMLAGFLGIQSLPENPSEKASGKRSAKDDQPALTRVRPLSGWVMYENESVSSKLLSKSKGGFLDSILAFWRPKTAESAI